VVRAPQVPFRADRRGDLAHGFARAICDACQHDFLIAFSCKGRERLAVLIPPPRWHRHRYFGMLAPNAPLGAAVTALAGLLKLRKRPFVCPEPKWLVWVVLRRLGDQAVRGQGPSFV